MIVDFYEFKTMQKEEREMEERKEETEQLEELSIDKVFERMLASKLRPELRESEEYKMLSRFISEITS
jgi:hypothetical protein